jgi:hypothetical protein
MLLPGLLLLVVAALGAFDVFYFHRRRARLTERRASRREAWIHVARGVIYTAQLFALPNVRFAGEGLLAVVGLFVLDALIAFADIRCEPDSRRELGGLPDGEYLAHVTLSVLIGAYMYGVAMYARPLFDAPTEISVAAQMPDWLRVALGLFGLGCLTTTLGDIIALAAPPPPVHVSEVLRAPLSEVWRVTQDHRLHPQWDHRFSKITMLADEIKTGTTMRYEKRIAAMVIRGFGRYKLHRPLQQSTFEFWSEDWRSPIRRGVGLWRYVPRADGTTELRTSYTYEVRWGAFGRLVDKLVLRAWFQRETERSFARLRALWFAA